MLPVFGYECCVYVCVTGTSVVSLELAATGRWRRFAEQTVT